MILALIPLVIGLLGGAIYGVWRSHEEAKADRLRSLQAAIELTRVLDRQCGRTPTFTEKAVKGFDRQRRMH